MMSKQILGGIAEQLGREHGYGQKRIQRAMMGKLLRRQKNNIASAKVGEQQVAGCRYSCLHTLGRSFGVILFALSLVMRKIMEIYPNIVSGFTNSGMRGMAT